MKKEWIKLLHRSFEEELSKEEARQLTAALQASPELRQEQAELTAMRNLFTSFSVAREEDFVVDVMKEIEEGIIAKRKIGHYLSKIFPISIAACVLILMSFIAHIYVSEEHFDSESIVGVNDLSPDDAYSYLLEE